MNRECLTRILRCSASIGFAIWFAGDAVANPAATASWEPDNWYQAEVVIFTQSDATDDELAPQDYHLKYPQRWLKLIDSSTTFDIGQLAQIYKSMSSPSAYLAVSKISVQSNQLTGADAALMLQTNTTQSFIEPPLSPATPNFELPYQLLKSTDRDLNDTARALVKRPPYEVIYHRAWRFPAQPNADDPWLIVEAGAPFRDRFQLEGSLRFYKSRFLHFESNLWLTNFANHSATWQQVALPVLERHATLDGTISADQASASVYKVESVWPFNQSIRLREAEVYYLDHPQMGIILTVKAYRPPLLNPDDKPVDEE